MELTLGTPASPHCQGFAAAGLGFQTQTVVLWPERTWVSVGHPNIRETPPALGSTQSAAPVDVQMDELQPILQRLKKAPFLRWAPSLTPGLLRAPCLPPSSLSLSPGTDAVAPPRRRSSRTHRAWRIRMKLRTVTFMHKTWHGDGGTAGPRQPPAASSRRPGAWPGVAAGLPSGEWAIPGGPGDGQPLEPWTCPRACTGCGRGSGDAWPGDGGSAVSVASDPPSLAPNPLPIPLSHPCSLTG